MNEFLYHATWEGSLSSIKEYGLAGKDGGAIYLAQGLADIVGHWFFNPCIPTDWQ